MDNNYCIYRHLKSCGEVFYIGIGNAKRPFERRHRNNLWLKTIKKYPNYEIQVLKENLFLEEAQELEKILISWYGRKCDKSGTLCNISLGGEGAFGVKHTEETRKRMSQAQKGRKAWNKGLKLSQKHREQLVKNSGQAKKVICTETGKIWDSARECAEENNINVNSMRCMLNGTNKNSTTFKYLENYGNESL